FPRVTHFDQHVTGLVSKRKRYTTALGSVFKSVGYQIKNSYLHFLPVAIDFKIPAITMERIMDLFGACLAIKTEEHLITKVMNIEAGYCKFIVFALRFPEEQKLVYQPQ